jgi:phosphoglycolate phosphatase
LATLPTVLLFDVDGTLITTGGVGRRAIVRSLEKCGVAPTATFSFAGMTDRAIVRRCLLDAGEQASEALIDRLLDSYLEVLRDNVAAAPSTSYRVNAGILEALDATEQQQQLALGLGTGNIEAGARIKLARVGIADRFPLGGFGRDSEDRAELISAGADRGCALLGLPRDRCRIVVIGDTPLDIAAAQANGATSLAVATGTFDLEALIEHRPTHAFESLATPGAIEALLKASPEQLTTH